MNEKDCSGVLVIAEMEGLQIHRVAYELLYKGRQIADACGEKLCCLLLTGVSCDAGELCRRGADKVYLMQADCFREPEESLFADNITAFIREYRPSSVLIGATHLGRSLAPRIAAQLGTGLTADCTELKVAEDGSLEQIRPAFSDNILAHIRTVKRPQMATVRYKEFREADLNEEAVISIEAMSPYVEQKKGVVIEETAAIGEADITDAEIIVAGGRGIRKEEDLQLLQELADVLGGQVGVSRALVDAGMAPGSIQVGYSGNRVKPKIYIACGISGAPQHLAGMKESDLIVAVNSDPSAPIFQICDYGFVGDLYEIVPKLTEVFRKGCER
ncbi:MAG: electron transfer flavoprotein subunit alpha/FixB family protein [Emergencia sp.]